VDRPDDVLGDLSPETLVVGPGASLYPEAFARTAGPTDVEAAVLGRLVVTGGAEVTGPEPRYLRRPDAVVPGPPKQAS
jgi:hypothetical protein